MMKTDGDKHHGTAEAVHVSRLFHKYATRASNNLLEM